MPTARARDPRTWTVCCWAGKVTRSAILNFGTESDKARLPAATAYNRPKPAGSKRKRKKGSAIRNTFARRVAGRLSEGAVGGGGGSSTGGSAGGRSTGGRPTGSSSAGVPAADLPVVVVVQALATTTAATEVDRVLVVLAAVGTCHKCQ